MDILKKYKLMLIDPIEYSFPEWSLCEELLGNLGKIEENKEYYSNNKIHKFYCKYNKIEGHFWLSYVNIWSVFENKLNMDDYEIEEITTFYIKVKYDLKDFKTIDNTNGYT
jgi:hypothetical protein